MTAGRIVVHPVMSTLVRMAAAAAGAVLAVAASVWFQPYLGITPYAPLYLVTFVAAWQGGLLPGLVAAGIAAIEAPPRLIHAGGSEQLLAQQVTLSLLLGVTAMFVATLSRSERRRLLPMLTRRVSSYCPQCTDTCRAAPRVDGRGSSDRPST